MKLRGSRLYDIVIVIGLFRFVFIPNRVNGIKYWTCAGRDYPSKDIRVIVSVPPEAHTREQGRGARQHVAAAGVPAAGHATTPHATRDTPPRHVSSKQLQSQVSFTKNSRKQSRTCSIPIQKLGIPPVHIILCMKPLCVRRASGVSRLGRARSPTYLVLEVVPG